MRRGWQYGGGKGKQIKGELKLYGDLKSDFGVPSQELSKFFMEDGRVLIELYCVRMLSFSTHAEKQINMNCDFKNNLILQEPLMSSKSTIEDRGVS